MGLLAKKPRKAKFILPSMSETGTGPVTIRPDRKDETILKRAKKDDLDGLTVLTTRTPTYNSKSAATILQYHETQAYPSTKNFQLFNMEDDEKATLLHFGKLDLKDKFFLHFTGQLSPLQAFGAALSAFTC